MVIAALLISSALMRIGPEAGRAFAIEQKPAPEPAVAEACPAPEDVGPALAAVQRRAAQLDERDRQIRDRMQALAVADKEIARKMAALTEAEEALRATLALADEAAQSDIDRLTAVYEQMKPKDAAALFETMAPEFAAGFLGRMAPEAAAGIMTGLSPETAYTISVVLAGRNADVPKN
ncbi:MotE family protein [Pseudooceanicola sp. 502str34]